MGLDLGGCLIIVVLFVVVGAIVVRQADQADKERMAKLEAWAQSREWTIATRPKVDWGRQFTLENYEPGKYTTVRFAIHGFLQGRHVAAAECSYDPPRQGNSRRTTYVVLLVVQLDRPIRTVEVKHRYHPVRPGERTLLDVPEFDAQFHVYAPDARAAKEVVGPRLIAAQLAGEIPHWSVFGTELFTYTFGKIDDPVGFNARFDGILRVAELLETD